MVGPAGQQEDLNFAGYEKVVQEELDAPSDRTRGAKLHMVSGVLRASLKVEYYPHPKVHGDIQDRGTRLTFGSCVVRNGIIRSIL